MTENFDAKRRSLTIKWVVAVLGAAVILIGGWFLYWTLAEQAQANRYEVNTNGQQYQSGLISQERDRVAGYNSATDAGQKESIKQTFCAVYLELTAPPADLVQTSARICS